MKQDLDRLMEERGLDAAFVSGTIHGNPAMVYMTNGAGLTKGMVIKKRGEEPLLLCWPMEREVAAESGVATVNLAKYDYTALLREMGDQLSANVEFYRRIFADLDVSGRVGFYGLEDRGRSWVLLNALDAQLDGIEVCGEFDVSLIEAARTTKDADEAARVRQIGRRTCDIIGQTVEFLQSHSVKDDALVQADGSPLTVGRVHEEINRFIAEQRLEDPEGFIFSIGRDAGVPHNKGTLDAVMELGKTIVFDIFPREAGGGYFADVTRTFCLSYAPLEVEKIYQDVYDCQAMVFGAYEAGTGVKRYQQMTCEFFADRGHPTIAADSQTESGYVHTIGHGIGLDVHEEPYFKDPSTDVLKPGHIFTCEPGLYYPDRGYGVRIEDDVWVDPDGGVHNLTDFPKELVIKL
ncbi:MAG: aminopeptidase P family protein [Anaerolineae bacterium]|nr:aminopeptidase P family protein [Anaerolineae bacterium]